MDVADLLENARAQVLDEAFAALESSHIAHYEAAGEPLARQRLGESEGLVTSEGTIYPLLSRMRRAGWVTTTWRESESGPPRRYYAITRSGQHALDGFATEWSRFRDSVDGVLGTGEGQHGARRG